MNETIQIAIIVVCVTGASLFVTWFANWMTRMRKHIKINNNLVEGETE